MSDLPYLIHFLERSLLHSPTPELMDEAALLLELYPRDLLPDWIEILANGAPEHFEAVREIALADIAAGEVEDVEC